MINLFMNLEKENYIQSPENISEEELENLMRLSVEQNKNLVLKLVKGHELKLDPDVIY